MIINDPQSSEKHPAIDLQVVRSGSPENWQFLLAYTATKNDTLVGHPFNRAAEWSPNQEINTGDQTTQRDVPHLGAVSPAVWHRGIGELQQRERGAAVPPGAAARGRQIPTFVINTDPLGTMQLPTTNYVDLRLDKSFRLVGAQTTVGAGELLQPAECEHHSNVESASRADLPVPDAVLRPRLMEFGVKYAF